MNKRQDTSIESVGAEHLVMGYLMREGIQTYMADQRQEGYDLICINPKNSTQLLIQVKSRWATNCDRGFPLGNTKSDFVAIVFLNSGGMGGKKCVKKDPEIYIVPTKLCLKYRSNSGWRKVETRKIPNLELYQNNWQLIINGLK